jgi:hypothetical protein
MSLGHVYRELIKCNKIKVLEHTGAVVRALVRVILRNYITES